MAHRRLPSLLLALAAGTLGAQQGPAAARPRWDDQVRVTVANSVHPRLARLEPIRPAAPDLALEKMVLVLKMPAGARADLDRLLKDQQDPGSPRYHQWLTPEAFGQRFGPGQAQVDAASLWLLQQGFTVHATARSGLAITFSGTAAQVGRAFRTAIMEYQVDGAVHHGNATAVSIPQGLSGFVAGVASLHDLRRASYHRLLGPAPRPWSYDTSAGSILSPGDFATIYNLKPLFTQAAPVTGAGVTIGVVGRTDLSAGDHSDFTAHLLGNYAGSFQQINNGPDPGLLDLNEQFEADIDTQWTSATAPGAAIQLVVSASSLATDGSDLSSLYLVDNNAVDVLTTSFGNCETSMGSAETTFYELLWAQAAGQGISVFVAAGDNGSAGCDDPSHFEATGGKAVSGLASTPYNVAVGGTMFNEGSGTYWSETTTENIGTTALGYIPEVTWNESGAVTGGDRLWAGSGGASTLYAKPSWQSAYAGAGDGRRDLPDVSLSAAGVHDPYLVVNAGNLYFGGGTSVAAPCMAGIMALVVQKTGARQGNPNPTLYALAQSHPAVFHDVVGGTNAVPGAAGFTAAAGYDLATGLGSLDATALVNNWVAQANPITTVTITQPAAPVTLASGQSVTFSGGATDATPGASLAYSWAFGDGSTTQSAATAHTFTLKGTAAHTFTATLTASDGTWTQSATVPVTVTPAGVSATITNPVVPLLAFSGQAITFTGSATTQNPSANPTTYAWDFGDGTAGAAGASATHTFASYTQGFRTVTLTATDGTGATGTAQQMIYTYTPWAMDLNFDNAVDVRDLLVLAGAWGTSATSYLDLNGLYPWGGDTNGDGRIDDTDLTNWINAFTSGAQ